MAHGVYGRKKGKTEIHMCATHRGESSIVCSLSLSFPLSLSFCVSVTHDRAMCACHDSNTQAKLIATNHNCHCRAHVTVPAVRVRNINATYSARKDSVCVLFERRLNAIVRIRLRRRRRRRSRIYIHTLVTQWKNANPNSCTAHTTHNVRIAGSIN